MKSSVSLLLHYHMDTARLLCGPDTVFWVLDLTDPVAFDMACALNRGDNEAEARRLVAEHREAILTTACIPAQTCLMSLSHSNEIFRKAWNITTPLPPGRYLAVVSGRLSVAAVEDFFTDHDRQRTPTFPGSGPHC